MRKIFLVIILVLFNVRLAFAQEARNEIKDEVKKDLVITTLDGEDFALNKMHNKVVIVNFFAYWCSDCLKEMAILDEIYQEYNDQGLEIISVSVDAKSARDKVIERTKDLSYPIAMLVDSKINNFPDYGVVPVTYFFDKKNLVKEVLTSPEKINKKYFQNSVQDLLAEGVLHY
ncbi:MAG: TlpA disulfide reductase family protein [Rickettsiales bacterium]|nr:TlpA disulfide reductase family protein [Rickettsiales bacterium]